LAFLIHFWMGVPVELSLCSAKFLSHSTQVGVSDAAVSMQLTQYCTGHFVQGKTNIPAPEDIKGSLT
jgi:hypothetical protein